MEPASIGLIILIVLLSIIFLGLLIVFFFWFRNYSPILVPPDSPIVRIYNTELSEGYAQGILIGIESENQNSDDRALLKFITSDNAYFRGKQERPKHIFVPAKRSMLRLYGKGVLSYRRVIGDLFPDSPDKLPETLRNDPVGRMLVTAIENVNALDNSNKSLRNMYGMASKIIREDSSGDIVDYLFESLKGGKQEAVEKKEERKPLDTSTQRL